MSSRLDKRNYVKIPNEKEKRANENEVFVSSHARNFPTACYIGKLLLVKNEKNVTVIGLGEATFSVIKICEYLRRRVHKLALAYDISNKIITEIYEPKEKGLEIVKIEKNIPVIKATLTITESNKISKNIGYLAPVKESEYDDVEGFKNSIKEYIDREESESKEGNHKQKYNRNYNRNYEGDRNRNRMRNNRDRPYNNRNNIDGFRNGRRENRNNRE